MKVTYAPRALAQLEDIFDYIASEDRTTAAAVLARITKLASLLSDHPYMGRLTNKAGVHVLSVPPLSICDIYKVLVSIDDVRILRVRHTARRPLKGFR